jgi:creatinine amidohydrolase
MLPKRDWMEMTWREIAAADRSEWIAVVPLAAVEQHGPHLPLGTDAYIAQAYLDRVRALLPDDLPVTFLPVQAIGHSEEHLAFPGTLTLSGETFASLLKETGASLHRAGIRKIVFANSHGGNLPAMELAARDLRVRLGMLAVTASWHRFGYPPGAFSEDEIRHGIHGGAIETALMLAHGAGLVRTELRKDFGSAAGKMEADYVKLSISRPAAFAWMTQDLNEEGALGNAKAATPQLGEAALQHGAKVFVELLEEVRRFDLSLLKDEPAR